VQLFPFTDEGSFGRYFNGPANVRFNSNLVVLESEELNNMPDLQRVVMYIMMYKVMQELYEGDRKQPKLVIIDEAWKALAGDNPAAAKFVEEGYRRARKYRASFFTGTQSAEDYAQGAAKAAFDNADWMFFLRQKKESIEAITKSGKLVVDPYTKELIGSVTTRDKMYSEVFVRCGDMPPSIGRLFVDPFSHILYSSKPQDVEAVKDEIASGKTVLQAIEAVVANMERQRRGEK
jgi:conjugal transfer ATP-binding protein TraC